MGSSSISLVKITNENNIFHVNTCSTHAYECNPSTQHLHSQCVTRPCQNFNFPPTKITLGLQACLVLRRASSSKQVATFQKPKAPEI